MASKTNLFRLFVYSQAAILLFVVLYFGSALFIPMCYGLLLAIVLYPLSKWLEKKRTPRSVSIFICLLLIVVLFVLLVAIIIIQLDIFRHDIPDLAKKFNESVVDAQGWIKAHLGVSLPAQEIWRQSIFNSIQGSAPDILKNIVFATVGSFVTLLLIPVYAALFLYNRETFVRFIVRLVPESGRTFLPAVLGNIVHTYAEFIKGTALVYLIVGTLNSIGLLALGIPHAILFGMVTAIMTIVPYVGILVSALLPISVAWITKDSIAYPVGVIFVFTAVQWLEANIIFPKVVSTRLNLSTWATLVAIIAGGILWGLSGMILFIPMIGILKIVFDNVPSMRVFNILLAKQ